MNDRAKPSKDGESPAPQAGALFFDWNDTARPDLRPELVDETLRDGLQSPSASDPPIEKKLALLRHAAALGVDCFALGFPASRKRQHDDALRLAQEVGKERLAIEVCCAARTLEADIAPIVEIAEQSGVPVQVGMFIGSSPIRQYTEGWSLEQMLRLTESAVTFAVKHGLEVLYVTEDSTRSAPETLRQLYETAIRCGAQRICVADTVGYATPAGAASVIRFVRELVDRVEPRVAIEWHGHRDRGLEIANCLSAWLAGAKRCHGTALGVGERCGNAALELLLVNLVLLGWRAFNLSTLPAYVAEAADALGFSIPAYHPVVGQDAFRTATGAHAAAVGKALALGNEWLADRVFSGVPAGIVGRRQVVAVGPFSGEANAVAWLNDHRLEASESQVARLLAAAKRASRILTEAEIRELLREKPPEIARP